MTSDELVEKALRRIVPSLPLEAKAAMRTTLAVMVSDALRLLPSRVKEKIGDAEAEIYRKNFTVALTSGQGALSSHTNLALASEPMIASEIVKVTHADAISDINSEGKLQRVGSESALNGERSTAFTYYAVEDNILYTMQDGDRTSLGGNATVRAAFAPAMSTVKPSHEFILVDLLVELAQGGANAAKV